MTRAETRRRVESMTRDGLTIGQVMAEVARMGDPVERAEVREIMAAARRHRAMQGHARRKRGEEGFKCKRDRRRGVLRDDGSEYATITDAARSCGCTPSVMRCAMERGRAVGGHVYRLKEM